MIRKIYDGVGFTSEWSAKIARWLLAIVIVSICYDVSARYLFNAPTNWSYTLSYMLAASFAALGLGYVHCHGGNVRVDVIYMRFSPRVKLIVDVFFTIIFFFPLYGLIAYSFALNTWEAFRSGQVAWESTWYPVVWPYMTMITIGFGLLFVQGIAIFMKDVMTLVRRGKEPW